MEEGAKLVCSYFEKKEPFLIGRNGSTELEVITYYMNNGPDTVFPEVLMNCLETYSGIFPPTQDSVRSWVIRYIDSLKECDVIAEGWYEPRDFVTAIPHCRIELIEVVCKQDVCQVGSFQYFF